jgi:hypothetical protein
VNAEGHDIVHYVVFGGNGMKYAGNEIGFFIGLNGFITKVGIF